MSSLVDFDSEHSSHQHIFEITSPTAGGRRSALSETGNGTPMPSPSVEAPLRSQYACRVNELGEHTVHGTCPDALTCLPDTGTRPQHTLPIIIRCAILGSPKKRMTIREIYAAMEEKYPYYRTIGQTWKQSVRHHLSLSRLFEKRPRPLSDPGYGSYWTVDLEAPPGTKRPRKRGRPNREPVPEGAGHRPRGRPRKGKAYLPIEVPMVGSSAQHAEIDELDGSVQTLSGTLRMNIDEPLLLSGMNDLPGVGPGSDSVRVGNCDVDEDRAVLQSMVSEPRFFNVTPGSARAPYGDNSDIVERSQQEVDDIRRREAKALTECQRMIGQLAQAQEDAARARAAQRSLELVVRQEAALRRDKERLRHDAEGKVKELQIRVTDLLRERDDIEG